MPLAKKSATAFAEEPPIVLDERALAERKRSVLRSVRSALARGVKIQLKLADGSVLFVYPPVVLTTKGIQFQSTDDLAQKPLTIDYVDILAVQPRWQA